MFGVGLFRPGEDIKPLDEKKSLNNILVIVFYICLVVIFAVILVFESLKTVTIISEQHYKTCKPLGSIGNSINQNGVTRNDAPKASNYVLEMDIDTVEYSIMVDEEFAYIYMKDQCGGDSIKLSKDICLSLEGQGCSKGLLTSLCTGFADSFNAIKEEVIRQGTPFYCDIYQDATTVAAISLSSLLTARVVLLYISKKIYNKINTKTVSSETKEGIDISI